MLYVNQFLSRKGLQKMCVPFSEGFHTWIRTEELHRIQDILTLLPPAREQLHWSRCVINALLRGM